MAFEKQSKEGMLNELVFKVAYNDSSAVNFVCYKFCTGCFTNSFGCFSLKEVKKNSKTVIILYIIFLVGFMYYAGLG